jgi:aspartyl protease family protein
MSVPGIEISGRFLSAYTTLLYVTVCVFILHSSAVAEELRKEVPEFEVVGLFKDIVVLNIEGNQTVLKVGGDPVAGIELISANSGSAVIEFDQQRQTVFLSQLVSGSFKQPETISVSIQLNGQRQYVTTGSINNTPVRFLVDTGATLMAMSSAMAKNLGVEFKYSRMGQAVTAGGKVNTWRVFLSSVQVGGIRRENVEAAVLDGDYPLDILLGMTFLRDVDIAESDGILVLSSKF